MDAPRGTLTPFNLFATPVLTLELSDFEDLNKRLLAKIMAQRAVSDGIDRSNHGGWHSDSDMIMWARDEARVLLENAVSATTKYTADISVKGKRDFQFAFDMWANVNTKGDSNQMHTHPGAIWSGVYYVDDGYDAGPDTEGGQLMLEDPRYPMNVMYKPDLVFRDVNLKAIRSQHAVVPKTGMMVLFPSWLRHSVRPYHGENKRISVAFNMQVVEAAS